MELLEDADGMVRDVARDTVIELFRNASAPAKADLKKQLKTHNVRQSIVDAIISQIQFGSHEESAYEDSNAMPPPRPRLAESTSSHASLARATTPQPEAPKMPAVQALWVDTHRELEDHFQEMHAFFEGRETEQNWLKREQSCTKIRRLNAGNAPTQFSETWIVSIKSVLDGILKAVNSLRTSLSKEGCAVVQEVAKTTGPGLDNMVEILLQNLIKLSGGTKKIASAAADATVDIIISHVSYHHRIMQHIFLATQDKNVQPRTYAAGWLKTLLKKEAHRKSVFDSHNGEGLNLVEKSIKKALSDSQPSVREKMRGTYWTYAQIWPDRAEILMSTLDAAQQKGLQLDPSNPNSPKKVEPVARPGLGFSKSTMGGAKPSIRDTILAQKKAAMAGKNLPARPGSAMSSFASPAKPSASAGSMSHRARPEPSTSVSHGGLSVAPMRPTKFRSKEVPRPATAGPYSMRPAPNATPSSTATPSNPVRARPALAASRTSPSTMRKGPMVARPNTSHSNYSSTSPVRDRHAASPIREKAASPIRARHTDAFVRPSSRASTPQQSPRSSLPQPSPKWHPQQSPRVLASTGAASPSALPSPRGRTQPGYRMSSPTKLERIMGSGTNDEELTMVIPQLGASRFADNMPHLASPPARAAFNGIYEDASASSNHDARALQPINPDQAERRLMRSPVLEEVSSNEETPQARRLEGAFSDLALSGDGQCGEQDVKKIRGLIDSGIKRLASQTLDAYSLRELQKALRSSDRGAWGDERFARLLEGLWAFIGSEMAGVSPVKITDLKGQGLRTIEILLRKDEQGVAKMGAQGLDALLVARGRVEGRSYIVSAYENLVRKLVALLPPSEVISAILPRLEFADSTSEGKRIATFCFLTLTDVLDAHSAEGFKVDEQTGTKLCAAVLKYAADQDQDVRRCATKFCAPLAEGMGEGRFWEKIEGGGAKEGVKSLMAFFVEKRKKGQ